MYTKDGRTLRQVFRTMTPKKNDIDQNKSELLAYIMSQLNCDMAEAVRAFNSMRNHNSKVLVFDGIERVWYGCDWTPDNKEAKEEFLLREVRRMDRRLSEYGTFIKQLDHSINQRSKIDVEFLRLRKHYKVFTARMSDDIEEIQQKLGIEPKSVDCDPEDNSDDEPAGDDFPSQEEDIRAMLGPKKKPASSRKWFHPKKIRKKFLTT